MKLKQILIMIGICPKCKSKLKYWSIGHLICECGFEYRYNGL